MRPINANVHNFDETRRALNAVEARIETLEALVGVSPLTMPSSGDDVNSRLDALEAAVYLINHPYAGIHVGDGFYGGDLLMEDGTTEQMEDSTTAIIETGTWLYLYA